MPDRGGHRYTDQVFEGLSTEGVRDGQVVLRGNEFEGCTFLACNLSEASLSGTRLTDCRFKRTELPLVDLTGASLRSVVFEDCRLTGVNFGVLERDPIGVEASFRHCDLNFALFRKLDLTRFTFEGCRFDQAEFRNCDLKKVAFDNCDLAACLFEECNLTDADWRTARNYFVSPNRNRIKGLRVSLPEALSLLTALDVVLE